MALWTLVRTKSSKISHHNDPLYIFLPIPDLFSPFHRIKSQVIHSLQYYFQWPSLYLSKKITLPNFVILYSIDVKLISTCSVIGPGKYMLEGIRVTDSYNCL
ncbi:hypothetical protein V8G54_013632 [Vigna mungo]|uniref:Uncharacterized protein n=1 Tax=Vigna mungo TaxID=3915 RepID=A0AAQ3S529_VIGMU